MVTKLEIMGNEDITNLASIGECWAPSFSPNGRQLAFISNLNGFPQLWVADRSRRYPPKVVVTTLNDPITSVFWSPTGQYLTFSTAPNGGMNEQAYIVKPDGTNLLCITRGGSENNRLTGWAPQGEFVVISSNIWVFRSIVTTDSGLS